MSNKPKLIHSARFYRLRHLAKILRRLARQHPDLGWIYEDAVNDARRELLRCWNASIKDFPGMPKFI